MSDNETLTLDDLPQTLDSSVQQNGKADLQLAGHSLADLERQAIQQTLKLTEGNRTLAAKKLGISVRTLQRKLKQWRNAEEN